MPELPDERLSAELQRRATLARSAQEWVHGDLADGVLGALQAQPAPVPSSRASRWLALAAVAVVLVLLVVALPSLPALVGPGQPSASPSASGSPTTPNSTAPSQSSPSASAPPGARLMYCGGYVLTDYTGIVADCAAAPELVRTAVPTAVNPNGDLRLLDVTWTGDACTPLVELQFRWSGTHYRLNDQESAPADSASMPCIGPAIPRGVHLVLSQSLAADSIELTVYGQPLLTPAPASATPTANAPVTGTDSSGDFTLTISSPRSVYSTGEAIDVSSSLVADADVTVSCLGFSGIGLHQTDGPLNFSPGPFILGCTGPRTLQVGVPVTDEFADVWALSDPDPIAPYMRQGKLYLPPGTYQFIDRASFYLGDPFGGNRVELTASIDIAVTGEGTTSTPTIEPATVFDCSPVPGASRHATLTDQTGLVVSCDGAEPSGLVHAQPPVTNPGGDQLRLLVQWSGDPCDASVAFTFTQTADGYALDGQRPGGACILPRVQHALEIQLAQPIDASTVVVQVAPH